MTSPSLTERLNRLVCAHIEGATVKHVSPLKGGVSANTTLIEALLSNGCTRKLVIREHGETHGGLGAAMEFDLLERLVSLGENVSEPIGFAAGDADRHPYVLLEYIEGTTEIPTREATSRIASAAEKLVAIHDIDVDTLPELPRRFDPLPELLDFLPPDPRWNELRATLLRQPTTAHSGQAALLHGDYWPANLVWDGETLVGVIDWEDAAIGDPLSDVACACLEFRYKFGVEGARHFLDVYSARRSVDRFRLALWQAYVAAAGNCSMDNWGLGSSKVAAMRTVALEAIMEAAEIIVLDSEY